MANPTTNYGFVMPTNTDLVKDLPADFDVFGQAVDTKIKDLNPETTVGDISYRGAVANAKTRIPIGTSGQALTVVAGVPSWAPSATSVLTTTGDLLFASAANTLSRRGIGSTGDVLTVSGGLPTWAAPSGAMTLISTTTFSGTPTTVLSSIPTTYNDLRVIIRLALPATDAAALWMRFNNDSTAGRTERQFTNATANNAATAQTFGNAELRFDGSFDNAVTNSLFQIDIPDYANTTTWKIARFSGISNDSTTTTSYRLHNGIGFYNQTSAITSLGFLFSTGNATSGTILLYGVK